MSRIRVTVDHLVLKGFDAGDRKPLLEGLKAELSRLLADPNGRAGWAHSYRTPILRLGGIPLEAGPVGGRKFGRSLAAAIGKGLKP